MIAAPPISVVTWGMTPKTKASPIKAATGSRYNQTAALTASTLESEKFQRKYPKPEQTMERYSILIHWKEPRDSISFQFEVRDMGINAKVPNIVTNAVTIEGLLIRPIMRLLRVE